MSVCICQPALALSIVERPPVFAYSYLDSLRSYISMSLSYIAAKEIRMRTTRCFNWWQSGSASISGLIKPR